MTITRKQTGTTLEISLVGRLDTQTAPELEAELEKGLDGVKDLIWNFSDLLYISSAGFRVLLVAQGKLEDPERMKVSSPNEMVRTAFILTGLNDLLLDS